MTATAEYPTDGFDTSRMLYSAGALDDVPLTVEESLDSDGLGDTDAGLDPLDDSWDAPDRPSFETRIRPTATERRGGCSLEEHLAQEVPDVDPYDDAERSESGRTLEDDVAGNPVTGYLSANDGAGYNRLAGDQAAEDWAWRNDGKNEESGNAPGSVTGFEGTAGNDDRDRRPMGLVADDELMGNGLTGRLVDDRANHGVWPLAPEEAALHID